MKRYYLNCICFCFLCIGYTHTYASSDGDPVVIVYSSPISESDLQPATKAKEYELKARTKKDYEIWLEKFRLSTLIERILFGELKAHYLSEKRITVTDTEAQGLVSKTMVDLKKRRESIQRRKERERLKTKALEEIIRKNRDPIEVYNEQLSGKIDTHIWLTYVQKVEKTETALIILQGFAARTVDEEIAVLQEFAEYDGFRDARFDMERMKFIDALIQEYSTASHELTVDEAQKRFLKDKYKQGVIKFYDMSLKSKFLGYIR